MTDEEVEECISRKWRCKLDVAHGKLAMTAWSRVGNGRTRRGFAEYKLLIEEHLGDKSLPKPVYIGDGSTKYDGWSTTSALPYDRTNIRLSGMSLDYRVGDSHVEVNMGDEFNHLNKSDVHELYIWLADVINKVKA